VAPETLGRKAHSSRKENMNMALPLSKTGQPDLDVIESRQAALFSRAGPPKISSRAG
jgi:hypothetical protein